MIETKPKARRFVTAPRLVVCGFVAWLMGEGGGFMTPGSWSDYHSQWLGAFLSAVIFLILFVATHWIWNCSKLQACCFWIVFGGFFTGSLYALVVSQKFLAEYGRAGPFNYLQHPSWLFDGTYHKVPATPTNFDD
jgi:hypothetical protein